MMRKLNQMPPVLAFRSILLWLCGRIRFPHDRLGNTVDEDGRFTVFRQLTLEPKRSQPQRPGANLSVRFQFKKFSFKTNRILSIIPIPFIVAQPGFRSKTWTFKKETGEFQGLYEWDTPKDAEAYEFSFPMKLMKKRAVPESLTYDITSTIKELAESTARLDASTSVKITRRQIAFTRNR